MTALARGYITEGVLRMRLSNEQNRCEFVEEVVGIFDRL